MQSIRRKLVPVTYTAGESGKITETSEVVDCDNNDDYVDEVVEDAHDQDHSDEEESPEVIEVTNRFLRQ